MSFLADNWPFILSIALALSGLSKLVINKFPGTQPYLKYIAIAAEALGALTDVIKKVAKKPRR